MISRRDARPFSTGVTMSHFNVLDEKTGRTICYAIDLMREHDEMLLRGFLPVTDQHLWGLRYYDLTAGAVAFQNFHMGPAGPVEVRASFTEIQIRPPLVPHHVTGLFGYWHINEQEEIIIPAMLPNNRAVVILIEGLPSAGRHDVFAWYCRRCHSLLHERKVDIGRVGIPGFWKAEQDAVTEFNGDERLRNCRQCGAAHPLAYTYFECHDTPEMAEARKLW